VRNAGRVHDAGLREFNAAVRRLVEKWNAFAKDDWNEIDVDFIQ
jgi:hypothetical protein